MSDRALAASLRVGGLLFGLVWLAAGVSKAIAPEAAYEFTARVLGGGAATKAALVALAGAETALGAAMVLGVLRGTVPTAVALAAVSAALLHVRSRSGGTVGCGCFVVPASVDEALVRNAALLVLLVPFAALSVIEARRRRAAAASGPATPSP